MGSYALGHISDSIGRKPVIVAGLLSMVVFPLAFALSPTFGFALLSRCVQFSIRRSWNAVGCRMYKHNVRANWPTVVPRDTAVVYPFLYNVLPIHFASTNNRQCHLSYGGDGLFSEFRTVGARYLTRKHDFEGVRMFAQPDRSFYALRTVPQKQIPGILQYSTGTVVASVRSTTGQKL